MSQEISPFSDLYYSGKILAINNNKLMYQALIILVQIVNGNAWLQHLSKYLQRDEP